MNGISKVGVVGVGLSIFTTFLVPFTFGQSNVKDAAYWAKNKAQYEVVLKIRQTIKNSSNLPVKDRIRLISSLDDEESNVSGIALLGLSDALERKLIDRSTFDSVTYKGMVTHCTGLGGLFFLVVLKSRGATKILTNKSLDREIRDLEHSKQNPHSLSESEKSFISRSFSTSNPPDSFYGLQYLIFKDRLDPKSLKWAEHAIHEKARQAGSKFEPFGKVVISVIEKRTTLK